MPSRYHRTRGCVCTACAIDVAMWSQVFEYQDKEEYMPVSELRYVLENLAEEGVEHGIGNAVADLVGVALRNGFGGEEIVLSGHVERSIGYIRHARKPL